ncbi:Uncharacterized protein dnl_04450 [Desulfonema limicola]|uniref:Uncharacterized protein n=1 Tax=Desulfonema limicola TaxID=45656 RepID=A0A975B3R0_9BACT|nr:hypothetical protein [Desulfonema limicola]QTA78228.1 Uncharacterized protein dnl_04450 [Desulfonema limicola]
MKCDKCNETIKENEKMELYGQILCEDCYIDSISPTKTCDPWAVHSAKSFSDENKTSASLNETQSKILQILKETQGIESEGLIEKLQIKKSDFERDFAALRHMEKVRAEMRDGKKILCLW